MIRGHFIIRNSSDFEKKRLKLLPDIPFAAKIQTMERQLTDSQMRTLRFIYDYIKSNDCPPTFKEIQEAFDISSTTAYERIHYLSGHGYLTRPETGTWGRDIELTEKGISTCDSDK